MPRSNLEKVLLAAFVLSVSACAEVHGYLNPPPPPPPGVAWEKRWLNHSTDDILLRYGKPTDELTLSTGNKVMSYHREVNSAEGRSSYGAYRLAAGGGSTFSSGTIFCDRRFEIDPATSKVIRAVITGTGCDYDL